MACAEGVGAEDAAQARLDSKSEGMVECNLGLLEAILLVLEGFGGGTEARSRFSSTPAGRTAASLRGNREAARLALVELT